MLLRELDRASQWQELDVFEPNVFGGLVLAFARCEFGNQAVANVTVVVDHEDVFDANVLVVQQRLAQVADDLIQVFIALEALEAERDAGHDGLLLLDDHARVGADGPEVKVVLDAEGEPEHKGQQQQQPGAKALNLGRVSHSETKSGKSASDVVRPQITQIRLSNLFNLWINLETG